MVSFFGGDSLKYTVLFVTLVICVLLWQAYLAFQFHNKVKHTDDDRYILCNALNITGILLFIIFVMQILLMSIDCIALFGILPISILLSVISCILVRKKVSRTYLSQEHSEESVKAHKSAWLLQNVLTIILCSIVCICIIMVVLKIFALNGITNIDIFNIPMWRKPILVC